MRASVIRIKPIAMHERQLGGGSTVNKVERRQHSRGAAKAIGAATALAACMVAMMPAAQASPVEVAGAQLAQAGQADFDIPVQPLTGALTMFGDQAGFQVTVDTTILAGRTAPAVSGRMSAEEALRRLLSGSGIAWRFIDSTTVLLGKAAADGAMTLDPVTVEGAAPAQAAESAYGPVHGYVARRTATATKTDTSIVETPQSISVVSAEEMETRNVQTLEDAIKYTPGVNLPYGAVGDARESYMTVRGFAPNYEYVDGMKSMGAWWERADLYMAERTEILRGPASVMYGQAAPGGIVNTVTKRPQDVQKGDASVEYGTADWKRAQADITGPLTEDKKWLYRMTAALQDSDGLKGLDHDRNDRKLFAPSLTWAPQNGTSVTLLALHQEDENKGWRPRMRYRTAVGETSSSTYLGEPDYDSFDLEQNKLTLLAEHAVSDRLKFNIGARYSHFDLDYHQVWTGSILGGGQTMNRYAYAYQDSGDTYQLDARAEGKVSILSTEHTITGGMDYSYFTADFYRGSSSTGSAINIFNPVYGNVPVLTYSTSGSQSRLLGFYAQDLIQVNEKWFFMFGGRQDMAGTSENEGFQDSFTGRMGVAYKTDFGVVPYASYAESFEPQSGTAWDGTRFEPTTGRQYEVGVKYEPAGVNAIATVAVFDLRKQNVLTDDPDATHLCAGSLCSVQTGEVRSRGVELGLTMGLAEGLNAVASYTYNPMEVSKSNVAGEVGRQMYDQPIHTASLWMDYSLADGPLAGLGFGGGLRFLGRTTNSAGNVSTSPQLLDEAMVRYDVEDWRLSLNVKNLLDREIELNCSRTANAETCYLQEPLTITARVARKF